MNRTHDTRGLGIFRIGKTIEKYTRKTYNKAKKITENASSLLSGNASKKEGTLNVKLIEESIRQTTDYIDAQNKSLRCNQTELQVKENSPILLYIREMQDVIDKIGGLYSDVSIPVVLLHTIRQSGKMNANLLSIEQKLHSSLTRRTASKIRVNNKIVTHLVSDALYPSRYLNYALSRSALLSKEYGRLFETVEEALLQGSGRRANIKYTAEILKEIKDEITKKIENEKIIEGVPMFWEVPLFKYIPVESLAKDEEIMKYLEESTNDEVENSTSDKMKNKKAKSKIFGKEKTGGVASGESNSELDVSGVDESSIKEVYAARAAVISELAGNDAVKEDDVCSSSLEDLTESAV
ncbi:hypothetical protein NEMIN01_1571 [Nematocida minor]|uniref:uncharacterized protein n=1 Tax=Nematocida minor TaxID=1912983 RepID=UPI002220D9F4|nr:uncharacterized protein NEMIN01_1571 [Nematocida minor]KAI5191545.1 hypothetical protein NEMIN01_1571 [Nematocida minor]